MMRGHPTECTLKKLTETPTVAMGQTPSWSTVQTFNGFFSEIAASEQTIYSRTAVRMLYRLMLSYNAITDTNRTYLTEGNAIEINSITYNILTIANPGNRNTIYVLTLERIK